MATRREQGGYGIALANLLYSSFTPAMSDSGERAMTMSHQHTEGPPWHAEMREQARVVGENVKRLRVSAKIPKQQFALMTNFSRPFLDKIERGEADPRLSTLHNLAAALDTTPLSLLIPHEEQKPILHLRDIPPRKKQ